MGRNLKSAKAAGSRFERLIADHLDGRLYDLHVDRQVKTGAADSGDLYGVACRGRQIAIECKNTTKMRLPQWVQEAHVEASNIGGLAGIVIHKRHGNAKGGDQWVTMTVTDLVTILNHANRKDTTE
nr:MAG TPA: HOLLIDAY JUNCTION RESOLVASE HOMOLOGOUS RECOMBINATION [Caudoviricetes sp.]